jgi:hypothetical protein
LSGGSQERDERERVIMKGCHWSDTKFISFKG